MAQNQITLTLNVAVKDGSGGVSMTGTDNVQQVGSNYSKMTQVVTSGVPVKLLIDPNIADGDLGYLTVRNLGVAIAGNLAADQPYLDVATDAGMLNKIMNVPPGHARFITPPGGTVNLWAQAHNSDVPATTMAIET